MGNTIKSFVNKGLDNNYGNMEESDTSQCESQPSSTRLIHKRRNIILSLDSSQKDNDTSKYGNIEGSAINRKRGSCGACLDSSEEGKSKVMRIARTHKEINRTRTRKHQQVPSTSQNGMHTNGLSNNTKIGFLGCGHLGFLIVTRLLSAGFKVYVWDRNIPKCKELVKTGAEILHSVSDVVAASDIIFCCVKDASAIREVIYGPFGADKSIRPGKIFVEMSGINVETSLAIANTIAQLGGRYLEVRVNGSNSDAENGQLMVIVCGYEEDYFDCLPCFRSFGRTIKYLGANLGRSIHMNMLVQQVNGVTSCVIAESLALGRSLGFKETDILDILENSPLIRPLELEKSMKYIEGDFSPEVTNNVESQLKLALETGNEVLQPLVITSAAHEFFKDAKRNGRNNDGNNDVSAIFDLLD